VARRTGVCKRGFGARRTAGESRGGPNLNSEVRRCFEWISHRASAQREQRLTFSALDGRQPLAVGDKRGVLAPEGRQHLAVGDERSEEPTESIKKKRALQGRQRKA
jgi:hypothetical protein